MATQVTGAADTTGERPGQAAREHSDGLSTEPHGAPGPPTRRARLAELAARIRALETGAKGPGGAPRAATRRAAEVPAAPTDAAAELLGGLERGVLHELCGPGDGAEWTPPLALLLALCCSVLGRRSAPADAAPSPAERAADRTHSRVSFVGRRTWPHPAALVAPPVLVHAGDSRLLTHSAGPVDPRLLDAALFVDTQSVVAPGQRGANAATRGLGAHVWAADRVLRARVSAAVVVDGRALAIGEVRRLQLAAEAGGALVLLVRPAGDVERPSSAASRWSLERLAHGELARGDLARGDSAAHGTLLVGWRVELRRRRRIGDGHGA